MRYATIFLAAWLGTSAVPASDWLTLPSTYTHDAQGQRVSQFQPLPTPTAPTAPNFRSSGYTHTRSSLNYGQSADNYHRVEEWGDPVRPYGEWRFPYRPFSTPYPNWGAPYAGFNLGFGGNPAWGVPRRQPAWGLGGGRPGGGRPGGMGPGGMGPGGMGPGGPSARPPQRQSGPIGGDGFFPQSGRYPGRGERTFRPSDPTLLRPYPAGPGTPYPVAPYYDGYWGVYRD